MVRNLLKLVSSPPPPTLSPLHVSKYSLPTSSRLPRFMIASVAGFILMTTAAYYLLKWFCFRKCCTSSDNVRGSENDNRSPGGFANEAPLPQPEEIQELQAHKAHAQLLRRIAMKSISIITYAQLAEMRSSAGKSKEEVESEACAVCLGEFSKTTGVSVIKLLPTCTHAFHSTCIDLWLSTQASCPVCRANLSVGS